MLRFGEWIKTTQPGLNCHLPVADRDRVHAEGHPLNRVEVGFRSGAPTLRPRRLGARRAEESLMLTGDENIVDINFVLLWLIKDAGAVPVQHPRPGSHGEGGRRERDARGHRQDADRRGAHRGARRRSSSARASRPRQILDDYGAGILITQVQLQKVDPPSEVIDAFRDVQRAQADRERLQNEAEAYANDILPRARGEAERIFRKPRPTARRSWPGREGDAQRFVSVLRRVRQGAGRHHPGASTSRPWRRSCAA